MTDDPTTGTTGSVPATEAPSKDGKPRKTRGIRERVEKRLEELDQRYPKQPEKQNGRLSGRFVADCMRTKELGDGSLYAAVNRGQYVYNAQAGEWMRWVGHYWEIDTRETHLAAMEDVVDKLLEEIASLDERIREAAKASNPTLQSDLSTTRSVIYAAIGRYRTDRGRMAAVKWARTIKQPLAIAGDELDLHPWLLACANGVLDLRTAKFRPGLPEEYLSKAAAVEWLGLDAPAPAWETFLGEVFEKDADLIAFLQRSFGYAVTGITHEHVFLVLYGQGRNGKGTFVETVKQVLGPLASPIQSEMLLDQGRTRSSAGPSPDIMALKGLRLAFCSETDEGRRFSPSRVKWLTGGDTLVGRYPHDKREVHFRPSHTLIMLTNNKPQAPADDFAFWERLHLVPFRLSFVDREPIEKNERRARKGLVDEFKKEGPGILAWLVRGCLAYQEQGLNPPQIITDETLEYRKGEQDALGEFLDEHCRLGDALKERATVLYDNFSQWFEDNVSKKGISQTRFGKLMRKRFGKSEKGTGGIKEYHGLELVTEVPNLQKKLPEDD